MKLYEGKRYLKEKYLFLIILSMLMIGCIFTERLNAQEEMPESEVISRGPSGNIRIIISTSGPTKFTSYCLDNPYRLIIEFKSKNVRGNLDKELVVNEGAIRRITSSYFGEGRSKALKTLTFELTEKIPYKIWQEGNNILLEILAPLMTSGLNVRTKEKEVFGESEVTNVVKRLEAMDTALKQAQGSQVPLENPDMQLTTQAQEGRDKETTGRKVILLANPKERKNILGILLFGFAGLVSISGLGYLFLNRYKYSEDRTKKLYEGIKELQLQVQQKDKQLEQVEIIRKTIEKTAIEKEEKYDQLKLELEEKSRLFEQEATMRSEKEKALQELEREHTQLKETSESLKDILVKRGIARQLTLPEKKGELWILGKSPERRNLPRIALTKDFHNTIILKIELLNALRQIKSFAENISSGGLCFEAKSELDEENPLNLRLFFYGGKVPNFRTQGWIVWKRTVDSKNYYGITFEGLSEKVKTELEKYIESNLPKG